MLLDLKHVKLLTGLLSVYILKNGSTYLCNTQLGCWTAYEPFGYEYAKSPNGSSKMFMDSCDSRLPVWSSSCGLSIFLVNKSWC